MACNHCGEDRFGNAAQLKCHVTKNHAIFSCDCSKKFMTEKSLLDHKESKRLNEKEHACSSCCSSFKSEMDLWNHKGDTRHWKPNERNDMRARLDIHPCDDRCGRIFRSEPALLDHTRDKAGRFADREKTCHACTKTFETSGGLAQHKVATGHSDKSNSRRKEHIDVLYKREVALSKNDKKESVATVDKTLHEIMNKVNKADGGHIYDSNVRKVGSFPIKAKIGKADEFDTQINVNVSPTGVTTRGNVGYSYNKIDPKDGADNNMNVQRTISDQPGSNAIPKGYALLKTVDGTIPDKLKHKGDLVPRAVKEDLHTKFKEATKDMEGVHLTKNSHGPAITLTITSPNGGHHISVDVTATVECNQPATITRPDFMKAYDVETRARVEKKGYCYVPKKNEFWLISNNNMGQELLSTIDEGNGCRRFVYKVMKKDVMTSTSRSQDGLPGISSHILKHHTLWCSEKEGIKDKNYWHMSNVDNCLIDTMKSLEGSLRRGKLPDYFDTSINILDGKDQNVLNRLADDFKARRMELMHM